ncbi:hypothetical protein [Rhizobium alvei]|uniref:Uncharacterized protein n=1 Tax=Rhizobium alvei TaxID=1132659 RepID=A0ABT8YJA5_9HYPH|nr:hypothetical protein [Rhizobium alvei]MDO6963778.1 hypothetical protein [Rhizobium alvei]
MNRFLKITLATTLSAAMLAGAVLSADAQPKGSPLGRHDTMTSDQAVGSGNAIDLVAYKVKDEQQLLKGWQGGPMNVMPLGELDRGDVKQALSSRKTDEPKVVAQLQQAVRGNEKLSHALGKQGVEIDNIIGAEQAADGGLTIYIQ